MSLAMQNHRTHFIYLLPNKPEELFRNPYRRNLFIDNE